MWFIDMARFTWNIRLLQDKQENSEKRMIWANKNDTSELAGRDLWCGTLYVDVSRATQNYCRMNKRMTRKDEKNSISKRKRHKRIGWTRFMPRHALCGCFTWNTRLLQNKQGNSKKKNDISSENDISSLAGRDLWCGAFYVDVSRETQGCYRISRKKARKEWHKQTKTI